MEILLSLWQVWLTTESNKNANPRDPTLVILKGFEGARDRLLTGSPASNPDDGIDFSKENYGFPTQYYDTESKTDEEFDEKRLVPKNFLFSEFARGVFLHTINTDELKEFKKHFSDCDVKKGSSGGGDFPTGSSKKPRKEMSEEEKKADDAQKLGTRLIAEIVHSFNQSLENQRYDSHVAAAVLADLFEADCVKKATLRKDQAIAHAAGMAQHGTYAPFYATVMEKAAERKAIAAEKKRLKKQAKSGESSQASSEKENQETEASPDDVENENSESPSNDAGEEGMFDDSRLFSQSTYGSNAIVSDPFLFDIMDLDSGRISPSEKRQKKNDNSFAPVHAGGKRFLSMGGKNFNPPFTEDDDSGDDDDDDEDADDAEKLLGDGDEIEAVTAMKKNDRPVIIENKNMDDSLVNRYENMKPDGFKSFEESWIGNGEFQAPDACLQYQLVGSCVSDCDQKHLHEDIDVEIVEEIHRFLDNCGFSRSS